VKIIASFIPISSKITTYYFLEYLRLGWGLYTKCGSFTKTIIGRLLAEDDEGLV